MMTMETEEFMETVPLLVVGLPVLGLVHPLVLLLFVLVVVGFLVILDILLVPVLLLIILVVVGFLVHPLVLQIIPGILLFPRRLPLNAALRIWKSVSKSQDNLIIRCSASLLHFRTPAQNSIMVLRFID